MGINYRRFFFHIAYGILESLLQMAWCGISSLSQIHYPSNHLVTNVFNNKYYSWCQSINTCYWQLTILAIKKNQPIVPPHTRNQVVKLNKVWVVYPNGQLATLLKNKVLTLWTMVHNMRENDKRKKEKKCKNKGYYEPTPTKLH
jgi:hypothetical protein